MCLMGFFNKVLQTKAFLLKKIEVSDGAGFSGSFLGIYQFV